MLRSSQFLLKKLQSKATISTVVRFQHTTSANNNDQIGQGISSVEDANAKFQQEIHISTKTQRKIPKRSPLAKNFLVGLVDNELLAFPEVIPRDDMSKLHTEIAGIQNYFRESQDLSAIVQSNEIPDKVKADISQLGLYGLNVSQHLGGRGYFFSESLVASEPEQASTEIANILLSHRVVIDILNEVGTDSQKDKYLPKLADGSLIATEAIFESDVKEAELFKTKAKFDSDGQVWILNGEKSFVVNGTNANLFIVLAQTDRLNVAVGKGMSTNVFLVEANTPGVKIGEKNSSLGLKAVENCSVSFDNVKLSEDNMIGQVNEGNVTADIFLKSSRLRSASVALGLTKNIINYITEYCVTNKQCGMPLCDMNILRDRMSGLICSAYAMESMLYYTAGLIDEFDGQDVALEAAVTKYYTLTNLWKTANAGMEFLGPKAVSSGEPTEHFLRSAAQLYVQGEPMDTLRMYISLSGLQHAGLTINDMVKKGRNPLYHPNHIFSKFFQTASIDNPSTKLHLGEHLHPTLEPAAQCLEHSIARLQMCVELLLTRYGNEIIEKQVEISRVTEMITIAYAMFTSVSRASRSYCIGLKLADHEMLLATAICLDGRDKIKILATEVFGGPYMTNDNNLQRLSKQAFKSGGYYPEHPLTYNF